MDTYSTTVPLPRPPPPLPPLYNIIEFSPMMPLEPCFLDTLVHAPTRTNHVGARARRGGPCGGPYACDMAHALCREAVGACRWAGNGACAAVVARFGLPLRGACMGVKLAANRWLARHFPFTLCFLFIPASKLMFSSCCCLLPRSSSSSFPLHD